MEEQVAQATVDPAVREWAAYICRNLTNNDLPGQVAAITQFVRRNVTYVRDPVGQEYLVAPRQMLTQYSETGAMLGDCDDHVMLLNGLLQSVGFDTQCLGVKHGGASDYNHVISGVKSDRGVVQIDPCQKDGNDKTYADVLFVKSLT